MINRMAPRQVVPFLFYKQSMFFYTAASVSFTVLMFQTYFFEKLVMSGIYFCDTCYFDGHFKFAHLSYKF